MIGWAIRCGRITNIRWSITASVGVECLQHGGTIMGTKIKARKGLYTYDDFCALIREDQKADLIDGVIYMASPENTDANRLFGWLMAVMSTYAEEKQLGEVFGSRVACRFDD